MVDKGRMTRPGASRTAKAALTAVAVAVATVVALLAGSTPATAAPAGPSRLDHIVKNSSKMWTMYVYSHSMNRVIQLDVLRPANTSAPRPILYLLNGAGGGQVPESDWESQTDISSFFADKNVNVVIPRDGEYSYYTDWLKADPKLGTNEWTTFLTKELPPIADAALGANGTNALGGLSMSGTSTLALAEHAPKLYKAVSAFSGCAQTNTQPGQTYVQLVVEARGGGSVKNMWGPIGGPLWRENDPTINAEKLRGIDLYIASGSGLPGPYDTLNGPNIDGDPGVLANQIAVGGVLEGAINQCTHALQSRLQQLNIPATYHFNPTGTHSWGYWQADLHRWWPSLAKSIGA